MKTIKRSLQVALCLSAFGLMSCKQPVQGDGNIIDKEIMLDNYNEIIVEGAKVDIIYEAKPDQPTYFSIETDNNLVPLIEVEVRNSQLKIDITEKIIPTRCKIRTNSPSLKYVENRGTSNIHLVGAIAGDEFKLDQRGVGEFRADNLVFAKSDFYLHGSGNIILGGESTNTKMEISGNGDIQAEGFKTRDLDCLIKGNGNITVDVTEKLSVEIKGYGNIVYLGTPEITKQEIKGTGIVRSK